MREDQRATLKFEKLTPRFFVELGRKMPDRARFFLWRDGTGRLVALNGMWMTAQASAGDKDLGPANLMTRDGFAAHVEVLAGGSTVVTG